MWSLDALATVNTLAHALAEAGKPEHDALSLMTDTRRSDEAINLLFPGIRPGDEYQP